MTDSEENMVVPKGKSILLLCCLIVLTCIGMVVWGIVESSRAESASRSKKALESIDNIQTTITTMRRINEYVDSVECATEKVLEINDQLRAENERLRLENESFKVANNELKERVNTLITEKNKLIVERDSFIDMVEELNNAVL